MHEETEAGEGESLTQGHAASKGQNREVALGILALGSVFSIRTHAGNCSSTLHVMLVMGNLQCRLKRELLSAVFHFLAKHDYQPGNMELALQTYWRWWALFCCRLPLEMMPLYFWSPLGLSSMIGNLLLHKIVLYLF